MTSSHYRQVKRAKMTFWLLMQGNLHRLVSLTANMNLVALYGMCPVIENTGQQFPEAIIFDLHLDDTFRALST